MNLFSTGTAAAALAGLLAITSIAPTQAQSIRFGAGERDRVISTYCDRHPGDPDCRQFHGGHWDDDDYDYFYRRNRSGLDGIAAGLFGFTFGAMLGTALANGNNGGDRVIGRVGDYDHVEACYARYRSYDERTDTFLGYDGMRHRCNL